MLSQGKTRHEYEPMRPRIVGSTSYINEKYNNSMKPMYLVFQSAKSKFVATYCQARYVDCWKMEVIHNSVTSSRKCLKKRNWFGMHGSWDLIFQTILILVLFISTTLVSSHPVDMDKVLDIDESESTDSRGEIREIMGKKLSWEDMELSAKEFLGKYGYVKPTEWNNVFPRTLEEYYFSVHADEEEQSADAQDNFGSGDSETTSNDEKALDVVTWSAETISEEQYHMALIKYQNGNGLKVTGELDNDTALYMGQPRCGVPDRTAAFKVNKSNQMTIPTTRNESLKPMSTVISLEQASSLTAHNNNNFSSRSQPITSDDDEEPSGDYEPYTSLERSKRSSLVEAEFGRVPPPLWGPQDYRADFSRADMNLQEDANGNDVIEEEQSDESRVFDLENILNALRMEKLSQFNATRRSRIIDEAIASVRPPAAAPFPSLVYRMVMEARGTRRKRSMMVAQKPRVWLNAYPKKVITWRLVDEWRSTRGLMTANEIWFTIKLAFRMWSEIIPRNFKEDNTSPITYVDILIGFGKKLHNRCRVPFRDGLITREYAHAWPLPHAEIHFNDDQPFVSVSWDPTAALSSYSRGRLTYNQIPISLHRVAVHEIGHTLGLPHIRSSSSVMNPVYTPFKSTRMKEIEAVDREIIQKIYGACEMHFDAVFDWVRRYLAEDGSVKWKYSTFFFRKTWFWLYENVGKRTRYGDPKYINDKWRGVLDGPKNDPYRKIDGVVQIRDWSLPDGPIYFFIGDSFVEYDNIADKVKEKDSSGRKYPRKIWDGFRGIPSPIDTVFYNMVERMLYFFKDQYVYKYDRRMKAVVSKELIREAFPGWGGAAPLPNNIDAAYYSYKDWSYYFFKDNYYWKMADNREREINKGIYIPENAVGPKKRITSNWLYICDVHETEMNMDIPSGNT